jgi:hypothetical protein
LNPLPRNETFCGRNSVFRKHLQRLVVPGDPALLVLDAGLEDQVVDAAPARGRGLGRKVARLDRAVGAQLVGVQRTTALEFGHHVERPDDRVRTQADEELVAQLGQGRSLCRPTHQLLTPGGQHGVGALARAASLGVGLGLDPAGVFHAAELAVDLLVRGLPEVADGLVETPRQIVAGRGLFEQRGEQGVGERHGRSLAARRMIMQRVA